KRSFDQEVGTGSFSPDGRWIVTGGFNVTTKLWDMTAIDKPLKDFGRMRGFSMAGAFSHDSQRLALVTPTGQIRIFRIPDVLNQANAKPEAELRPRSDPQAGATQGSLLVNYMAFHPT